MAERWTTILDQSLDPTESYMPPSREEDTWYLLPGTGFNVRLQIDQLQRDLQDGLGEGKTFSQILESNLQKIEQDIQGFKLEYLCEGLLFPIILEKKTINGEKRIVASLYDNKLLIETVSETERQGAVKRSLEKIESFLLQAPPGSIAVMSSPPGKSGFEDISYEDTQTYIFKVEDDGTLRAFAVRTDMNIEENQALLETLGKKPQDLDGKNNYQSAVEIVENPLFLEATDQEYQFEDIVNMIKNAKKTDFALGTRSFDEIYQNLKDPANLLTIDRTTQELINKFKFYVREKFQQGTISRDEVEMALGKTVLEIAHAVRGVRKAQSSSLNHKPQNNDIPYMAILSDVQDLKGCNGGGIFTKTLSPRKIDSRIAEKTLNCRCPFCGKQVDAVIAGGKITCPECEKSAPYEC